MVRWNDLEAAKSEVYKELEAMRVLLDEMDWFSPRFYDFIPTELFPKVGRKDMRRDELEYRKDMAGWLRTYVDKSDRPDRPIIPIVRSNWVGGAGGYEEWVDHPMPVDEFIDEQVMPALTGGADGVMLWEGWDRCTPELHRSRDHQSGTQGPGAEVLPHPRHHRRERGARLA